MKKRIKILRIQSRICIGGPALHTELLSKYLPAKGYHNVLVGGAVDAGEFCKFEEFLNAGYDVRIIDDMRRSNAILADFAAVVKLYRLIKKERPNIVCTHTAKAGAVGRIAALLAGVPHLFHTFHGHVFDNYFSKPLTWLFLTIERILARFTDRIITISPAQLYDLTVKYCVAPKSRFQMVRLGFELEPFLNIKRSNHLKQQLCPADDCILIGIVGRLAPIKNHLSALRIMRTLMVHDQRYHLVIVGDGTEREGLEAFSRQHGLTSNVHFVGWINNMIEIYAGIDLLLLTSLNEGTPVTIIEAMASGVPVVSSRVGGVPDLITEGVTGSLFEVNREQDAADKIMQLSQHDERPQRIIDNARAFVRRHYCYTRMIDEMDRLYKHHLQKSQ